MEVFGDGPILTIGDFYAVVDKNHSRFGQIGKCTDVQYPVTRDSLCTIKFRDGIYSVFKYNQINEAFVPNMEVELRREPNELLDTGSSFNRLERDRLLSAHDDRVKGYKKESARQVKKIEAMDKVDKLLNKRIKQREEIVSWENGTWYETHWQPDYRKIGFTAALQGVNIITLIACLASGGFLAVLSPAIFTLLLAGNYYVLKNNLLRNEE